MTSAADPQGWGRTDGLLIRQPVRAEARRLFMGSDSLTWIRRPRLASPGSTTEVETDHPHVKEQLGDPSLAGAGLDRRASALPSAAADQGVEIDGQNGPDGAVAVDDQHHLAALRPLEDGQQRLPR